MTLNNQKLSHLDDERPERSRNAKAQARHRAKRKAYIEQVSRCSFRIIGYKLTFSRSFSLNPRLQSCRLRLVDIYRT